MLEYIKNRILNFTLSDGLAIVVLAVCFSVVLIHSKKNNAIWFSYIVILYYISTILLCLLGVFDAVTFWVVVLLPVISGMVIFSSEIRREISRVSHKLQIQTKSGKSDLNFEEIQNSINQIVKASQRISKQEIGALFVVSNDGFPQGVLESGTYINAEITAELLEALFAPKASLHDGAVLIQGKKIIAAGCYLPLSQETNIPKELGTRHRAAIGMTETYPSTVAIVVSEETGIISAMYDGKLKRYLDSENLTKILQFAYLNSGDEERFDKEDEDETI